MKLTEEELNVLMRTMQERLEKQEQVAQRLRQIDVEVAGVEETKEKLLSVVKAFVPEDKSAKVVLTAITEWMNEAETVKKSRYEAERMALTRPVELTTPIEEVVDKAEDSNRNDIETQILGASLDRWLLLGLTALQLVSIIISLH